MRLCSSHITFNVARRVLLSVFVCLSVCACYGMAFICGTLVGAGGYCYGPHRLEWRIRCDRMTSLFPSLPFCDEMLFFVLYKRTGFFEISRHNPLQHFK